MIPRKPWECDKSSTGEHQFETRGSVTSCLVCGLWIVRDTCTHEWCRWVDARFERCIYCHTARRVEQQTSEE